MGNEKIDAKTFQDNFEQGESLGKGAFGSVQEYVRKDGAKGLSNLPKKLAVKTFAGEVGNDGKCCREVSIMQKIGKHVNIVACFGFFLTTFPSNMISLLMEKCIGTLYDLVPKSVFERVLKLYEVSRMMKQLLEGLAYLHEMDIVHRDIKPNNILLQCSETDFDWEDVNTSLLTVKLCDFGVSRSFEKMERHRDDVTVAGTLAFCPPEFIDAMIKNLKTIPSSQFVWNIDTWATGIVAFMMRKGHLPVLRNNDTSEISVLEESNGFCDFLLRQLKVKPKERATARQLLSHSFISDFKPLKEDIKQAAKTNDLAYIKTLFEIYNGFGKHGEKALEIAAEYNRIDVVKLLLENCDRDKAEFIDKSGALAAAAEDGNLDLVKLFLQLNCKKRESALWRAAFFNRTDVVKLLLENCDGDKAKFIDKSRALVQAARKGNVEIVKLSLKHNCKQLEHALCGAAEFDRIVVAKLLLEHCDGDKAEFIDKSHALIIASKKGNLEIVKLFLDFDCKKMDHALFEAAYYNMINVVKMLLENLDGDKAEFIDKSKALVAAARNGYLDLLKLFMKFKCNVNVQVGEKITALHLAVLHNKFEVVKYLAADKNIDVNVQNKWKETPLHWATVTANLDMVKYLVENCNARMDNVNDKGQNPKQKTQHCLRELESGQWIYITRFNGSFSYEHNFRKDDNVKYKAIIDYLDIKGKKLQNASN